MKDTKNDEDTSEDRSVLDLIRGIQNGSLDPSSLGINERRLCVEHLTAEGCSVQEIAGILHIADRTISRDRASIRRANAIEASPELTSEMVGNLLREADTAVGRIRRAVRSSDVPPADKIEAEKSCWVITRDVVHCLQRLGYLPTAPQTIQGHMTHDVAGLEAPEYEDLQAELARLEVIFSNARNNADTNALHQITLMKDTVTRLVLSQQVEEISSSLAMRAEAPGEENAGLEGDDE